MLSNVAWSNNGEMPMERANVPMTVPSFGATEKTIIRRLEAAGARHVLRDDRRIARNVLAHMLREHASVEIVAAAGREADDQ